MMVPNILYGAEMGVICTDGTGLDWTDRVVWCHAVYVKDGSSSPGGGLNRRMQLFVALMLSLVTMDIAPERLRM